MNARTHTLPQIHTHAPSRPSISDTRTTAGARPSRRTHVLIPLLFLLMLTLGACGQAAGGASEGTAAATPAAWIEEDVTLGTGDWAVKGKLCLPAAPADTKALPLVVLVSGSGPNDMDETVYSNKPFRDIAQGLAAKGVASLRYNKITKENPKLLKKLNDTLTLNEEYLPNVHDALALVEKDARFDAARIFVLGHSLGGTAIPRIDAAEKLPAGYIFLAGSNAFLGDELLRHYNYLFGLDGKTDEDEKNALAQAEAGVAKIKAMIDGSRKAEGDVLGAPASYWLDLYNTDPLKQAAAITKPVLILQGDRDYNVLPENAERWQKALTGSKDVTLKHYAALNHLFLTGEGKDDPVDLLKPRTVDAGLIADLAAWILAH